MAMKREFESMAMANCLMLLSRGVEFESVVDHSMPSRVFECKTCNRQFSSFQALGGHRASHKKPRLSSAGGDDSSQSQGSSSPAKPKTHECSICGLEFAIGQALGGHMRRHRAAMSEGARTATATAAATAPPPRPLAQISAVSPASQAPVVKKTNSGRVLWLDLNLTPMENESDLEFRLGTKTPAPPPVIDCYVV
ncbi:hypothetical protein ACJRO7_028940 [Eucalyptus globulus]|uniref:C2H2-type domain-containing protein n=1 Tax=Eucalyptus globulus TaxID=34317 RepID=A0ABD3JYQ0_EUCGL